MDFSFDKKGFFHIVFLFALIIGIGFILRMGSQQLTRFFAEQEGQWGLPQIVAVSPRKQVYKSLGEDAVLYPASKDVLTKK